MKYDHSTRDAAQIRAIGSTAASAQLAVLQPEFSHPRVVVRRLMVVVNPSSVTLGDV